MSPLWKATATETPARPPSCCSPFWLHQTSLGLFLQTWLQLWLRRTLIFMWNSEGNKVIHLNLLWIVGAWKYRRTGGLTVYNFISLSFIFRKKCNRFGSFACFQRGASRRNMCSCESWRTRWCLGPQTTAFDTNRNSQRLVVHSRSAAVPPRSARNTKKDGSGGKIRIFHSSIYHTLQVPHKYGWYSAACMRVTACLCLFPATYEPRNEAVPLSYNAVPQCANT